MRNTIETASNGDGPIQSAEAPTASDALDTFLWQADPHTLRLIFVSGQVRGILGGTAAHWLDEKHPWRSMSAAADRSRVEAALRHAVRSGQDDEIDFVATGEDGDTFPARLVIRVMRSDRGISKLWGLLTDESHTHRRDTRAAGSAMPRLSAPPLLGLMPRLIAVVAAMAFASYALAVSALRPGSDRAPVAAAMDRAGRLEKAFEDHADDARLLESAVGGMERSVGDLVALRAPMAGKLGAFAELRAKIENLLAMSPPELTARLRVLLATLDRVTAAKPHVPSPAMPAKPAPPPAQPVAPPTQQAQPTSTPTTAPPPAQAPAAPDDRLDL